MEYLKYVRKHVALVPPVLIPHFGLNSSTRERIKQKAVAGLTGIKLKRSVVVSKVYLRLVVKLVVVVDRKRSNDF